MRTFYQGAWRSGHERPVRNPYDESVLDMVPDLPPQVLDHALEDLIEGSRDLRRLSKEDLHQIFVRLQDLCQEGKDRLIDLIRREQGKSPGEAEFEWKGAARSLEALADNVHLVGAGIDPLKPESSMGKRIGFTLRQPHGLVGILTPSVYPLLLPVIQVCYALGAGNAVAFKPARTTPLTALALVELLLEAGLPPRAIACFTGAGKTLGSALCADSRLNALICLGRIPTIKSIRNVAAFVPMQLQWGCASSVVVTDGVDPERVVQKLIPSALENAGQSAFSPTWVAATPGVYEKLIEKLVERMDGIRVGDPGQRETEMGPVVSRLSAQRFDQVLEAETAAGANVACGGIRTGRLIQPTLLRDCQAADCVLSRRECPAPILGISPIHSSREAFEALGDQRYHVLSVFTENEDEAVREAMELPFENIHVNGVPTWRDGLICVPGAPPRMGRRHSEERIRDMSRQRDVVCH